MAVFIVCVHCDDYSLYHWNYTIFTKVESGNLACSIFDLGYVQALGNCENLKLMYVPLTRMLHKIFALMRAYGTCSSEPLVCVVFRCHPLPATDSLRKRIGDSEIEKIFISGEIAAVGAS
jgi:hypothetical protein